MYFFPKKRAEFYKGMIRFQAQYVHMCGVLHTKYIFTAVILEAGRGSLIY